MIKRSCARISGLPLILIAVVWISFVLPSPSHATTLTELLDGISSVRQPETLRTFSMTGEMHLDMNVEIVGFLPDQVGLFIAWRTPDEWLATYEISDELASGGSGGGTAPGGGHPAVDHVYLSRPDIVRVLEIDWNATYTGTAMWDGDPSWIIEFSPKDHTVATPSFEVFVRKDDFIPLRTAVHFPDGTIGTTDLTWIEVDDLMVPSVISTVFSPAIGPLNGYESTFINHDINPDLSSIEFPQQEGMLLTSNDPDNDDGPSVFEELYHGFADDPIVAELSDASGTYDRISFTFSLYVEDGDVVGMLNDRSTAIRTLASDIVSSWEWTGDDGLSSPGGKYECGVEIRDAIGELLETDAITDFYFLEFNPIEAE